MLLARSCSPRTYEPFSGAKWYPQAVYRSPEREIINEGVSEYVQAHARDDPIAMNSLEP
jgi:hypothetical protein